MSDWVGVVTNAGKSLLGSWIGGSVLNLDSAAEGSGTVLEASLPSQTALTDQEQSASILEAVDVENGKKIKIRVTSENVTVAHTCKQLGIWASVDSGASVLLCIIQNTTGQPIPAFVDIPDFVWDFYIVVEMSNEGTFTLTVDTSALATTADVAQLHEDMEAADALKADAADLDAFEDEVTGALTLDVRGVANVILHDGAGDPPAVGTVPLGTLFIRV